MRLTGAEFKKLFSSRLFVSCLALFFIINAAALYFFTASNESYKYELSLSDDIKTELAYYGDMSEEDAKAELNDRLEALKMASQLQNIVGEQSNLEDIAALNEQYKAENPKAYEQAQQILSDGFSADDLYIAEQLNEKYAYIDEYAKFIDEMQARKDSQLEFSIFSKPDTFAYNNIEKTPLDFEGLRDVKITPGYDLGLNISTAFALTDYLALILVLLVCIALFVPEREKGLFVLVKSARRGRWQTYLAKLVCLVLSVLGISAVFYISDLALGGAMFGLGDLSRSIQSVPEFMNCPLKISVLEYLALWTVKKALTLCAAALIAVLLFTVINSETLCYIALALIFGAEFCLHNFVGATSALNHFKYINIFYYLSGNGLFGSYLNLNFFKTPVNAATVFWVFIALCFAIVPPIGAAVFSKRGDFAGKNLFAVLNEKIRLKTRPRGGSASLFKGECYKHYISGKALFVILAAVLIAFVSFSDDIGIQYTNGADAAYAVYMGTLEGELTPEKEKFITDEQNYLDGLYDEMDAVSRDKTLTEDEKSARQTAIDNILQTRGKAFEEVMIQYDSIKQSGERLGITPCFVNTKEGKRLMTDSKREWNCFALLMLLTVLSGSAVFAYEHKREMQRLICSTQKGKTRLALTKISVALMTYLICFTLVYLPYFINYINTFGTDIFSYPLVFLQGFERLDSKITILPAVLLEGALHLALGLASLMLILLLSDRLKSTVTVMIASTAATLIPCLLVYFNANMRLFSLFMNNQLAIIILLIVLAIIAAALLGALTVMKFTNQKFGRKSMPALEIKYAGRA